MPAMGASASSSAGRHATRAVAAVLATVLAVASAAERAPPPRSDRSYYLAMHDGTRIALSLYFPGGVPPAKPAPVMLVQTRYGRATQGDYAEPWRRAGYVVAVVDTRGSTASFGPREADIGPDEIRDMDEIIAHVASRPWSNGQVIASGVSYMADTADMATSRPAPALVAAIPRETDFDAYLQLFNPGGVSNDFMLQGWGTYSLDIDLGRDGRGLGLDCRLRLEDCPKLYPTLQPVDDDPGFVLLREALGSRRHWAPNTYESVVYRDDKGLNGYGFMDSSPASQLAGIRREKKPVQYWGSWVDGGTAAAALARFRSTPGIPADVWITGNNHGHDIGADPLRPDAKAPLPAVQEQIRTNLEFAERVRRGEPIGRRIHYYVLGSGVFRETGAWPPPEAKTTRLSFATGHRLVPGVAATTGIDQYAVDFTATTGKATRWSTQFGTAPDYPDRRDEDRKLLVYDTEPMTRDTLVAGNAVVSLRVATATADPAFFAYLEDVAPDGRVSYLAEGQLRAIHRKPADPRTLPYDQGPAPHSFRRADGLAVRPGEVMDVRFALFPTAALVRSGHRLRLAIAGADADTFHRYSEGRPETFSVQYGTRRGSYLEVAMTPWSP